MRGFRLYIAKKKAKKVWENYHPKEIELRLQNSLIYKPQSEADENRVMGIYRKTKVFCSNICCGNPRRYKTKDKYGSHLTKQELMAERDIENWESEHWEDDYFEALHLGEEQYGDK